MKRLATGQRRRDFFGRAQCILFPAVLVLLALLYVSGPTLAFEGTLNLNTANAKELQQLPFIGKERARAIVLYRKTHGKFTDLQTLIGIDTIGQATFEAIKPYLTLSDRTKAARPEVSPDQGSFSVVPRIVTQPGQILLLQNEEYYPTLLSFIAHAQKSIRIGMFLFKTTNSPQNRPKAIVDQLLAARKRGVEVVVVLDKSGYDDTINKENGRVARRLQQGGVTVYFDSEKRTSHAKIAVFDNRYNFIGSHNFTHSALVYNNEVSVLIDSTVMAKELTRFVKAIQSASPGQ